MSEDLSRLLGLDGFVVTELRQQGDELEVELVAAAGCCRHCGRGSVEVKERPVVRVRDLPIAGRMTLLSWRKRRFPLPACARSFTEAHAGSRLSAVAEQQPRR